MYENRKEKRNPEKLQVLLSSAADPSSIESALTENVGSRGLRVRTERPWTQDTCVIVLTCESKLWARGRVAYCQALLLEWNFCARQEHRSRGNSSLRVQK